MDVVAQGLFPQPVLVVESRGGCIVAAQGIGVSSRELTRGHYGLRIEGAVEVLWMMA